MGVRPEQYDELIAADPGGDLKAAFDTLSAETANKPKVINGNEMRIWAASFEDDYKALKAAAVDSVKAEVAVSLIDDPDSALDLHNPTVAAIFDALPMSEQAKGALNSMSYDVAMKYPCLTSTTILQNARDIEAKFGGGE